MVECFGVSVNVRNVNYGVSDKIIATIKRMIKAIKYSVSISMC